MKHSPILVSIALALTACAGCSSSVEVQNKSKFSVREMIVAVGGNDLRVNELKPGETVVVSYKPKADSSIAVTFQTNHDPMVRSCEADVYVTSPSRDHFLVTVNEDNSCRVFRKPE